MELIEWGFFFFWSLTEWLSSSHGAVTWAKRATASLRSGSGLDSSSRVSAIICIPENFSKCLIADELVHMVLKALKIRVLNEDPSHFSQSISKIGIISA